MLPFGVTIPATVPQGSEIPEGLMNNLVYVSTLSHKWHDFRKKKVTEHNVFWLSVQLLSATFLILRRERDVIRNVYKRIDAICNAGTS